jgi:hypothetical protein
MEFYENPFSASRVVASELTHRQTGRCMKKLTAA